MSSPVSRIPQSFFRLSFVGRRKVLFGSFSSQIDGGGSLPSQSHTELP